MATDDLCVGETFCSRMEATHGSFGFDFEGTYARILPQECIEYTFGDRLASVAFVEGSDGVTVRVAIEAESTHSIAQQQVGWQAMLETVAKHVASQR